MTQTDTKKSSFRFFSFFISYTFEIPVKSARQGKTESREPRSHLTSYLEDSLGVQTD